MDVKPIRFVSGVASATLLWLLLGSAAPAETASALHARSLPFAGYARQTQPVKIILRLPMRNQAEAEALEADLSTPKSPSYHKWLTTGQFMARYAPLQRDVRAAAAALRAGGFTIRKTDAQFVYASAPAASVERFFNTRIGLVRDGAALRIDARAAISLPEPLFKIGASVIGLQAIPLPHPDHRVIGKRPFQAGPHNTPRPNAIFGPLGPYFPGELLQGYSLPGYTYSNGSGMTIAIVGISDSSDLDNQALWCYYGLGPNCAFGGTLAPYPTVNHFEAAGSDPPDNNDAFSLEAALDAQMAGGTAPGATIDQYAVSPDDSYFLEAYSNIVNTSHENIVSTSYSFCELQFLDGNDGPLQALHQILLQGNLQGQTFVFSSGDSGAFGCAYLGDTTDPAVNAYAADADATGVGGTTQFTTTWFDNGYGTGYASESSYSYPAQLWGSGGGVSQIVRAPRFQNWIGINAKGGRQVPDIAMHMGGPVYPFTADFVSYEGYLNAVIGTSCAAPQFAGTLAQSVAAVNGSITRPGGLFVGNVNNFLYYEQFTGFGPTIFHQIVPGDNLVTLYQPPYIDAPGYNQVIGLGSPKLPAFVLALGLRSKYVLATDTFTANNP